MDYNISIKDGVSGHFDYDRCDLCLIKIEDAEVLPRIGDTISLKSEKYLVKDVQHTVAQYKDDSVKLFYTVYVMKF